MAKEVPNWNYDEASRKDKILSKIPLYGGLRYWYYVAPFHKPVTYTTDKGKQEEYYKPRFFFNGYYNLRYELWSNAYKRSHRKYK